MTLKDILEILGGFFAGSCTTLFAIRLNNKSSKRTNVVNQSGNKAGRDIVGGDSTKNRKQ